MFFVHTIFLNFVKTVVQNWSPTNRNKSFHILNGAWFILTCIPIECFVVFER